MTQKAHFIGLCGAGMSAVAYLMKQAGYQVTGSDAGFYPPISDYITQVGLKCFVGYAGENIPSDVDIIVIGKNAKLVTPDNPEVRAAFDEYEDKIHSFPEILARLTQEHARIVVAGSYGKSTLTSMITWCLVSAGKKPGYFIGAVPKNLDTSSDLGKGEVFVFEGDEYPSANWDDRAKFLHYAPEAVVLTSACHDHVNIYPTLESYHAPFKAMLQDLKERQGVLIACTDEKNATDLYQSYIGQKVSYGLTGTPDWSANYIQLGEVTRFDLLHEGRMIWSLETTQLGRHNIQNIVGAAAYLLGQDILTIEEFSYAIARFEGLTRRLDRKSDQSNLVIYEGFGSSYEKTRAAIEAIRDHFPKKKLTVLFEPHTFSWRNRKSLTQYQSVFKDTDTVWLYAPPTQGADTHDQLELGEIFYEVRKAHHDVRLFDSRNLQDIVDTADPERDVILILSSGSFDGQLASIITQADVSYPKL